MSSPHAPWYPPPVPPKRKIPVVPVVIGTVVAVVVLCLGGVATLGAVFGPSKATPTTAAAAEATPAEELAAAPSPEPTVEAVTTLPAPTSPPATRPVVKPTTARPRTTVPKPRPTTKKPKPRPTTEEPEPEPEEVYYANCTEARAAGVTPIHRGEPGYSRKLDRDNDGVACE